MSEQKKNRVTKHKLAGVISSLVVLFAFSSQVYAQGTVNIALVAGYAKGHSNFDVVVKDTPGTKLVMYVNDKSPSQATVNKSDWATFHKVSFVNWGKVSFTKILSNGKQQPINYVRYYQVSNGKLNLSINKPAIVVGKKASYQATLWNIADDNNIPMIRPAAGWDSNDGWDTAAQATIDEATASAVTPAVVELNSHQLQLNINVKNTGSVAGIPSCTVKASSTSGSQFDAGRYYGVNFVNVKALNGGPIDPGQYGNATDTITITGQGAYYINEIRISC